MHRCTVLSGIVGAAAGTALRPRARARAGHRFEPEPLHKRATLVKEEGYRYMKWFTPYGPGNGPQGMNVNVELVRNLRQAVGEDVQIMIDAFSGGI